MADYREWVDLDGGYLRITTYPSGQVDVFDTGGEVSLNEGDVSEIVDFLTKDRESGLVAAVVEEPGVWVTYHPTGFIEAMHEREIEALRAAVSHPAGLKVGKIQYGEPFENFVKRMEEEL